MATNEKATRFVPGVALSTATYLTDSSALLARTPDLSRNCPFRAVEREGTAHCWGGRCAAFRPLNATHGICLLIERG